MFDKFFLTRAERSLKDSLTGIVRKLRENQSIDRKTLIRFVSDLDNFGE